MNKLTLSNVSVEFPFRPYPCQVVYMEKVIQALQQQTNAILESPTGTGKTLCLLCATLAWRESLIKEQLQQFRDSDVNVEEPGTQNGENPWDIDQSIGSQFPSVPKIIYASRTHSQLSQVIHELKNTKYRPRVAIIGSREQLCIHPEVSKKETNAEKVHLCRAKIHSHACFYYTNTDLKRLKSSVGEVMDIEDLTLTGTRHRMCPYYLAREFKSQADVIFMPYNYILDVKGESAPQDYPIQCCTKVTRRMHGVDIQGTVVILDEAHNIERVCEESASFDITSNDLAFCIADVQSILEYMMKEENLPEEGEESDIQDYANLKDFFLAVETALDGIQFPDSGKREVVKPGDYIFDFFERAGLTAATCMTLMEQCTKAISFLTTTGKSLHKNGNNIQKMLDAVKITYNQAFDSSGRSNSSHQYKVFIKVEENLKKNKKSDVWTVPAQETHRKEIRTLSYWCFSPGYVMKDLVAQGVRSIVLTSGTLSPLDSFSSELKIDFPVRYEGPHVISEKQVWVGVVTKGCDGVALNSSYVNRSSLSYQSSLGNTIVNFARTVPHGLLVFFPSYPLMFACKDSWHNNGILQRIEQYKPSFWEPRRKSEFNPTMDAFYERILSPDHNGAAFFAVCRGKVSEGLDFADMNGRAVIITGQPFPPRMDPRVTLKMQYLQEELRRQPIVHGLSGDEWYKQQASRAVNQAVGRVIRHRNDFGAIILCDERFAYSSSISQLPQWVRPYAKVYNKFGLVQRDISQFFKTAEREFGGLVSKAAVSDVGAGTSTSVKTEAEGSSGGRSYQMPIVVRDPSRRGGRLQPQDASTVDIHLPSKLKKYPKASLTKLKDETESDVAKKGLLSSLVHSEESGASKTKTKLFFSSDSNDSISAPSLSESIMNQRTSASSSLRQSTLTLAEPSSSSAGAMRQPTKKIVTISKKSDSSKMANIASFIKELQDNLSNEAYHTFKTDLGKYKKTRDIYAFTESLKDIFKTPSLFYLLQGMYSFILDDHKETYGVFYKEITGKSLQRVLLASTTTSGVKRKVQSAGEKSKEEPKIKRPKLDQQGPPKHGQSSNPVPSSTELSTSKHLNCDGIN